MVKNRKPCMEKLKNMELKYTVRILSLVLMFGFGVVTTAMVVTCSAIEFSISDHYHLMLYTVFALMLFISSICLFISSFTKSMWLVVPMVVFMILLIITLLFNFFLDGLGLTLASGGSDSGSRKRDFTAHIENGGDSAMFTSFIALSLLLFAFLPVCAFLHETQLIHKERKHSHAEEEENKIEIEEENEETLKVSEPPAAESSE